MSKPLDRITLLETFVRIADAGSISAAARDLGLSQPSASRQLSELESRLETLLVHRTTHALSLTPAGRALLGDARELIGRWDALEDRHAAGRDVLGGPLKIVAPVALGQAALADLVAEFQHEHPGVAVDWVLDDAPIRFADVGCDCWIRIGPVPDDTLVVRRLGRVERLLVAAPALVGALTRVRNPASAAKLGLVALTPFEGAAIPLRHAGGRTARIRPPVRTRTNNIVAARAAALAGIGMAVMPRWFVDAALTDGALVDVLPAWRAPALDIHVAYASDRYQPLRLRAFLDALTERIAAIPGIEAAP